MKIGGWRIFEDCTAWKYLDKEAQAGGGKDAAPGSRMWEDGTGTPDFSSQLQVVQRMGAEESFSAWPCFLPLPKLHPAGSAV